MTAKEAKNVIVNHVIPKFDKESLFGSYVIDALMMAISALEKLDSVSSAQPEQNAYEQGKIAGRVEMRTEILGALKKLVGSEVWDNV